MQLMVLPTSDTERRHVQEMFGTRARDHGAYILVDADEAERDRLLSDKILFNGFEEAEEDEPSETSDSSIRDRPALEASDTAPDEGAGADSVPEDAGDLDVPPSGGASLEAVDDGTPTRIALLRGPMTAERQHWLQSEGVELLRRLGTGKYVVSGDASALLQADAGAPWLSLRTYGVPETIGDQLAVAVAAKLRAGASLEDADAVNAFSDAAGSADEPAMYDVRCLSADRLPSLASQLELDPRVQRVERGRNRLRYHIASGAEAEAALLVELGRDDSIETVERYVPPEPMLDYARAALVGRSGPYSGPFPWQGAGETIGVADSGIDPEHPDFAGRLRVVLRVPPASPRDPMGHGTHVASIAAGDGTGSNGTLVGAAPQAQLFVQSIADQSLRYQFGVGLTDMLQEAYQAGVRVQNYSWGARLEGRYSLDALDVDEFVYNNPDMLVVIAAGNAGEQDPDNPAGRHRLRSLASPATAKNALAVGASCSSRPDGPYAGMTWKQYDGSNAPQAPAMCDLPLTSDPDIVAALSSRGPSDDGRVKPDLVAPGVGVAGAKSAHSGAAVHAYPPAPNLYQYLSGTSMAAPLVAGAAAIVRQYYRDVHQHAASAALLKATLINGTEWLSGDSFVDSDIGTPNFHQGYGRLNLARAIPFNEHAAFKLRYVDIDNKSPGALVAGNAARSRFLLKVRTLTEGPLSVTLAWTDPPARHIQHNLDLVLISPDGSKTVGNADLKRLPYDMFDRSNNVEQARVPQAVAGEWIISVTAQNTFRGAQGFALALAGAFQE